MALNSVYCADVLLSNYSLTHSLTHFILDKVSYRNTWRVNILVRKMFGHDTGRGQSCGKFSLA